jgi:hypothetical protein
MGKPMFVSVPAGVDGYFAVLLNSLGCAVGRIPGVFATLAACNANARRYIEGV